MTNKKKSPNSLANLSREGRPTTYDEPKKLHRLTVTPTGWEGVQAIASTYGISVSQLLEKLGRKQLVVVDLEQLEDRLDLEDALEALSESDERIGYEQFRQELGLSSAVQD